MYGNPVLVVLQWIGHGELVRDEDELPVVLVEDDVVGLRDDHRAVALVQGTGGLNGATLRNEREKSAMGMRKTKCYIKVIIGRETIDGTLTPRTP